MYLCLCGRRMVYGGVVQMGTQAATVCGAK